MNPRIRRSLPLAVALALVAACGSPVAIKTSTTSSGCPPQPMTGVTGDLVTDPAGIAIIDVMNGQRVTVTWPVGWTARSAGLEVEVLDEKGHVVARTGSRVDLLGDYGQDSSFVTCGPIVMGS